MDRLRIAFCDDDALFRTGLRRAAEAAFRAQGLGCDSFEAGSAAELSAVLGHRVFDLIFLDIEMPGTDGIRFGEELRARGCRADIVYVSNMEDKVYEIFRVHPWSFLRKSRFSQELPALLEEYARAWRARTDRLLLTGERGETIAADPIELVYVEAVGKTQKLVFSAPAAPAVLVRDTMRDLEEKLLPFGFIRIHKGFLVNYRFIRRITSRSVLLDTGSDLPVGRDRLGAARERYLDLMKWKGLDRSAPENG